MSNIVRNTIMTAFVIASALFTSQSQAIDYSQRVDIKCYVELIGGGERIFYNYNVLAEDEKKYKNSIVGLDIAIKSAPVREVIYKVNECQRMEDDFVNSVAQSLENIPH